MARFTVILPEGSVILKNVETGETLRLSAEKGPMTLGELEMNFSLNPAPANGSESQTSAQSVEFVSAQEKSSPTQDCRSGTLPPGFGFATEEEPFLSPKPGELPAGMPDGRPFIRVLDAPMEALTIEDFEKTLESLVLQRNNMEGELAFLKEIEADPEDIDELTEAIGKLDEDLADILRRKKVFEELPKKLGIIL